MPGLRLSYWQRTRLDGVPANAKFLTLAARDRIPMLDRFTRGFEGLRVTVMGTRRIGSMVAQLASSLGMRVGEITRDPSRNDPMSGSFTELRRCPEDIETTARETDYLVLALLAAEGTRGLIDSRVLKALGPSGVLVNLARPSLMVEGARLSALRRRELQSAYVPSIARHTWLKSLSVLPGSWPPYCGGPGGSCRAASGTRAPGAHAARSAESDERSRTFDSKELTPQSEQVL